VTFGQLAKIACRRGKNGKIISISSAKDHYPNIMISDSAEM
jgi:hypothetical protein